MPRSRSRSLESITRSATCSLLRKMPLWCSMASTNVVFPWSTCAMIAILRMVSFCFLDFIRYIHVPTRRKPASANQGQIDPDWLLGRGTVFAYAVGQLPSAEPGAGLGKLFEWIKYLESGTPEIPIVACGDGQPMPAGGRRDVAVFDGHAPAGLFEQPLLFRPHVCN